MQTAPNPDEAITNFAGGIGNSMSLRQLHQWRGDRFGPHAVVKEPANRSFDVPWMVLDATRAWQRFGWRVQTPLASILEEIASHAAANPQWLDWTAG